MSVGATVSYAISLESRKFLDELRKARKEAKDAARAIEQDTGGIGDGAKRAAQGLGDMGKSAEAAGKSAQKAAAGIGELGDMGRDAENVMKVFNSTSMAFANALNGNFVGAAMNAAKAIKGLTAAMEANPILLVVSALGALAIALYNAAKGWQDYRERCKEAKEETKNAIRELQDIRFGPAEDRTREADVQNLKNMISLGMDDSVKRTVAEQRAKADKSLEDAAAAAKEVEKWKTMPTSMAGYSKKQVEENLRIAEAQKDAAKERLAADTALLNAYVNAIAEEKRVKEEAAEAEKKAIEDKKAANEAEAKRLREANAAGDAGKMRDVLKEMAREYEAQFGKGSLSSYEQRISEGTVTEDEIKAYQNISAYRKSAIAQRGHEDQLSRIQKEKDDREADQRAREEAAAAEKLARSRENMMVSTSDKEGLEKLLDSKRKEFAEKYAGSDAENVAAMSQQEIDARAEILRIEKELQSIKEDEARKEKERIADAEKLAQAREKALVAAGDAKGLEKLAEKMLKAVDKKFGEWKPGKAMTASLEELDARAAVDRVKGEAYRAGEPARKAAEEAAKKAADLEEKKDAFLHRNDTAAQRLARNSEELKAAKEAGDEEKMLELMQEGEALAANFQEPMSKWEQRKAAKKAKRDAKSALRAAKAYRRQVAGIEREMATGEKGKDKESSEKPTVKVEGQEETNNLLKDIKEALQ